MIAEIRVLSVAALVCVATTAAPADLFDKDRQGRLSDSLNQIALVSERGARLGTPFTQPGTPVPVVIELADGASGRDVAPAVEAAGGRIEAEALGLVKAWIPVGRLREVSADRSVVRIRSPLRPNPKVVSQGVATMKADAFVSRTGANGAGVRVGVLDAAFQGAREMIGGELPADTQLASLLSSQFDSFASSPHGTACAEIVSDVAPGASLVLAAFTDEVTWSQAIDELAGGGVKIISHSVGFDNVFPPDGNHYFAQKVDAVTAAGVLFVTAAGNEAGNYFQGGWRDDDGDSLLDFAPGTELLPINVAAAGSQVVLRWDDSFGTSNHDYDLLVVTEDFQNNPTPSRDNPAVVAVSADAQKGAGDPREILAVPGNGQDRVLYAVVSRDTSTPLQTSQRFYLFASSGVSPSLANGSGTLSLPADARGAVTVGAVAFDSGGVVEGFSSRGPTADGRVKPDLAAPDGVQTVSYGGSFPGTSAATPHASGAAALLLSRTLSLDAASLRQQLERATATSGAAKNNDVGYGLIDLDKAP